MDLESSAATPVSTPVVVGHPKLRPLDVRQQLSNGRPCLLLRDPLQLSEQMLLVPQPLASVLAFCDGTMDPAAMAAAFFRHFGMKLETEMVRDLIAALDEALLLDNERSQAAVRQVRADYQARPFRTPLLAGGSYPADRADLHDLLEGYLGRASAIPKAAHAWPTCMGLLSPHIDYPRGGPVYAEVWQRAAEAVRAAELVVIFGTDHYGNDPFTLTRQHYATPYGVLPTDQSVVNDLVQVLGEDAAFAGELRHRDEHSLELPAVWLHHLRGGEPVEIVPILTGALPRRLSRGDGSARSLVLEEILAVLSARCAKQRTVVVASGDLAHVGPAFGGDPLTPTARRLLRAADDALLRAMRAGDSDGFHAAVQGVDNRNNVCGVAPIYLTMRLVQMAAGDSLGKRNGSGPRPIVGEQHGYAECPADDRNTSAVTVAGMVFTEQERDG